MQLEVSEFLKHDYAKNKICKKHTKGYRVAAISSGTGSSRGCLKQSFMLFCIQLLPTLFQRLLLIKTTLLVCSPVRHGKIAN